MDKPITPCLWFDGKAREAAEFYTSIFPNSKMGDIGKAPEGGTPSNEAGDEMVVEFTLNGQNFTGLNGGPMFTFSEAISFQIFCGDQTEVDHYFDSLTAGGGEASYCGWLKDKFGLSWQVIPMPVLELLNGPKGQEAFAAINKPEKIVIAEVQAACA